MVVPTDRMATVGSRTPAFQKLAFADCNGPALSFLVVVFVGFLPPTKVSSISMMPASFFIGATAGFAQAVQDKPS